jgi:methylmalonyl-CoA mutase
MEQDFTKKPIGIATEFPPVTTEQWEAQILKDLKGADYNKKLVWKTNEGFPVKPYYTAEDLNNIQWLKALPGDFPFVRGNAAAGNEWLVRQDIKVENIGKANEKALDILLKGVDSLGFELGCKQHYSIDDIEALLKNIRADIAELNFYRTPQQLEIIGMIDKLARKYNRPLDQVKGSVEFDPLLRFARRGTWYEDEASDFCRAYELIKAAQSLPAFKVLAVNGHHLANAGASIVQEMAFTLAAGNEYLSRLTEKGLFIGEISPKIKFNLAVGSNYFMEIAKIRAYRLLWAHIVNAYGLNDARNGRMFIHAKNTDWNFTVYDPYVNMLRTTTSTMSAIIGGVDSFTVVPFDAPYETPTAFAERIARNQQLVLKEESYLDIVADPAAGSYYIESLTNTLAEESWKLFLQITDEGGFVASLRKGIIQKMIAESAAKKDQNIASRREILLGTNQFPNFDERIDAVVDNKIFDKVDKTDENAEIETIKTYRGAQAFEKMRFKTDVFSLNSKRPVAWMFTYGNLAMRKARANFACNFFACAGIEVVDNYGFTTVQDGITAALEQKPEIVVICSSDDEYAGNALSIYEALKNQSIVVLAGYPDGIVDELKAAGMKHFIHVRSNVLETLQSLQVQMGIV